MQIEILVGLSGLLLLAAVAVRGSAALAVFTYGRMRAGREDRRILQTLRDRSSRFDDDKGASGSVRLRSSVYAQTNALPGAIRELELVVAKRVIENEAGDICSFYLTASNGQPLPIFEPGQFLTFRCTLPGMSAPVTRCYSLSMHPGNPQEFYRISVKRLLPNLAAAAPGVPGLVSNFFHDHLQEGAAIEAMPPAGSFCLDTRSQRPVVLIAGGIGMTPLLSMLDWLAATQSQREVWVFYGVRNKFEHAFKDHFRLIKKTLPHVNQVIFYSQPTTACQRGVDYHETGHVNVEYMKHVLRAGDYEFYVCGPDALMQSVTEDLLQWGVPADAIKFESFGGGAHPSSATISMSPSPGATAQKINIEFSRSKKRVIWTGRQGSLLELAEACGIKARHSCRAGQCGTCKTGLRAGQVAYASQPASTPESGTCLPCIARPTTDLVLDL